MKASLLLVVGLALVASQDPTEPPTEPPVEAPTEPEPTPAPGPKDCLASLVDMETNINECSGTESAGTCTITCTVPGQTVNKQIGGASYNFGAISVEFEVDLCRPGLKVTTTDTVTMNDYVQIADANTSSNESEQIIPGLQIAHATQGDGSAGVSLKATVSGNDGSVTVNIELEFLGFVDSAEEPNADPKVVIANGSYVLSADDEGDCDVEPATCEDSSAGSIKGMTVHDSATVWNSANCGESGSVGVNIYVCNGGKEDEGQGKVVLVTADSSGEGDNCLGPATWPTTQPVEAPTNPPTEPEAPTEPPTEPPAPTEPPTEPASQHRLLALTSPLYDYEQPSKNSEQIWEEPYTGVYALGEGYRAGNWTGCIFVAGEDHGEHEALDVNCNEANNKFSLSGSVSFDWQSDPDDEDTKISYELINNLDAWMVVMPCDLSYQVSYNNDTQKKSVKHDPYLIFSADITQTEGEESESWVRQFSLASSTSESHAVQLPGDGIGVDCDEDGADCQMYVSAYLDVKISKSGDGTTTVVGDVKPGYITVETTSDNVVTNSAQTFLTSGGSDVQIHIFTGTLPKANETQCAALQKAFGVALGGSEDPEVPGEEELGAGAIIAIVLGSLAVLGLGIYCCCRLRNKDKYEEIPEQQI